MSIRLNNNYDDGKCIEKPCSSVELVINARPRDLGGFSVNRVLPYAKRRMVGPWVFFDHMGPADFKPGEGIDVRPHPHINLATVTYLFTGKMLHRDSLGSEMVIKPGAVNLMVAGSGIVHSERTPEAQKLAGQKMEGLQLWLGLPEKDEEIEPAFFHYAKDEIPETKIDGADIRVIIGSAYGLESPVKTFARTLYVEVKLEVGQKISAPQEEELAFYVVSGAVEIDGAEINAHEMAVLKNNNTANIKAKRDSVFVFIGGKNIGQRHVFWNFVSSRKERIEQAKQDWKDMKFPLIAGDDEEFIPLPE